jgi:hypothetical protein
MCVTPLSLITLMDYRNLNGTKLVKGWNNKKIPQKIVHILELE